MTINPIVVAIWLAILLALAALPGCAGARSMSVELNADRDGYATGKLVYTGYFK